MESAKTLVKDPHILRVKNCCFFVPLNIGLQIFIYFSMVDCVVVLGTMANIAWEGDIECSSKIFTCTAMGVDSVSKILQGLINVTALFCIYKASHFKYIFWWVAYSFISSIFTIIFFKFYYASVEHEPDWSYYVGFVWDMYGCLVGYSYYKAVNEPVEST